jgi:hypothetical protein
LVVFVFAAFFVWPTTHLIYFIYWWLPMALPSLLFVFTLLFVLSTAQYGAQSAVNVSFVANLHTTGQWVTAPTWLWSLVHLPDDYASTTTKVLILLILFFSFVFLFLFPVTKNVFLTYLFLQIKKFGLAVVIDSHKTILVFGVQ